MANASQKRKLLTFIGLFCASLLASTIFYANFLTWSDGSFIMLQILHQQRSSESKFYDYFVSPNFNACSAAAASSSDGYTVVLEPEKLSNILLQDFGSMSPNHALCLDFETSPDGENCSAILSQSVNIYAIRKYLMTMRPNNASRTMRRNALKHHPKSDHHRWPFTVDDLLDLRNVLLISHFNLPTYKAAAKVDALYRNIFADILYCGPTNEPYEFYDVTTSTTNSSYSETWQNSSTEQIASNFLKHPKFLGYGYPQRQAAENVYRCLPLAVKRFDTAQYDGILLMSDDMMLNVWRLRSAGKELSKNWMMKGDAEDAFEIDHGRFCYKNDTDNDIDCRMKEIFWLWTGVYRQHLMTFYEELETLAGDYSKKRRISSKTGSKMMSEKFFRPLTTEQDREQDDKAILANNADPSLIFDRRDFWHWIRAALQVKTGGRRRMFGRASGDCFYVTQKYIKAAANFFALLDKHRVFVEIAVGTVLKTISQRDDLQFLDVTAHDWGQMRGHPITSTYATHFELVHPFKLSQVHHNGTATRCTYCNLLKLTHAYSKLVEQPCLLTLAPNNTLELPLRRTHHKS